MILLRFNLGNSSIRIIYIWKHFCKLCLLRISSRIAIWLLGTSFVSHVFKYLIIAHFSHLEYLTKVYSQTRQTRGTTNSFLVKRWTCLVRTVVVVVFLSRKTYTPPFKKSRTSTETGLISTCPPWFQTWSTSPFLLKIALTDFFRFLPQFILVRHCPPLLNLPLLVRLQYFSLVATLISWFDITSYLTMQILENTRDLHTT